MTKKTLDNRLTEIAHIRARFLTLDREADEAERAPLPRAEAEARIDEVIEALAAQARPELLGANLISPARPGSTAGASGVVAMLGASGGTDHGRMIPAGCLLAAAAPDQLREWLLSAAAEAAADQQPPLSAADRAERLKLLAAERADLEKAEAEACWLIEDQGVPAVWRGDMSPALVLGLEN